MPRAAKRRPESAKGFAEPSLRAREAVRGAYDLHVHVEPDLVARSTTDLELARRFGELGLAGFVLKSHYVPTAERAAVVSAAVPGVRVLGSLTLNASVGGLNPLAVEIAAREGAHIIWLPTVDAENEASERAANPGRKQPAWARFQNELASVGLRPGPVAVVEAGIVVDALTEVLGVVARHELVLSTGHLSRTETLIVVDAALAARVSTVLVTHADYPMQGLRAEDQRLLADRGALLERCFAPSHTGKVPWERMFDLIRATGVENNVLSTDLGQVANPPVEDGLALLADRLFAAGFSDDEVQTMAVTNTRRLAGDRAAV